MRHSSKIHILIYAKIVAKSVFLITRAFEVGTVMVVSWIQGGKNYVPVGNLISKQKVISERGIFPLNRIQKWQSGKCGTEKASQNVFQRSSN